MKNTTAILCASIVAQALCSGAEDENEPFVLPQIVVTDQAPENLQAVSVSRLEVTPAGSTDLRETESFSGRVPNMFIANSGNHGFGDVVSIRGAGNTVFFSSPALGTYVDGVALGDSFAAMAPLYGVESVEIFRGPQHERFGLNGEAGILSLQTKRPGENWHGVVSGSYGTYETQDHRLSLSGPLVKDQLSLSLSGIWSSSEGYVENTNLNRKTDTRQMFGGRAILNWTPAPGWEITAGFEGNQANEGTQRFTKLGGPNHFQVSSDVPGSANFHQHREWLKVAKEFETFKVLSITGHSEWEMDPFDLDLDLTSASATFGGIFPGVLPFGSAAGSTQILREQEIWNQEIRFESLPPTSPDKDGKNAVASAANGWRWATGIFAQGKQTHGDDFRQFSFPFVTPPSPFGAFTIYTPVEQRIVCAQREETYAGYANATYSTGPWEFSWGARLDYTRKTFNRLKETGSETLLGSGEYTEWTVAPAAGALLHINADTELFARTSLGFKPGGFSPHADNPALARYEKETVWASELGVRTRALNGRLRGSLTAFYHHFDEYQIERAFELEYLVVNAEEARSYGIELELTWELLEGLTLNSAFGYNHTELTNYTDPITGENFSGNEAPFTPKFTARVSLDYALSCGFRANLEYLAIGEVFFSDTNAPRYAQSAYGLLNARVGFERDSYGVYLFGRNLADKEYYSYKQNFIDGGVVGEPRILGVMAVLKF